jgi:hypothetical protein
MTLNRHHNPELIRNGLFARCKFFWGAGLSVKVLVFILGVVVVVAPIDGKYIAIIGLILAVASESLMWLSDRWKGAAHGLHRKLDFENSFGWFISESELMDYLARYPGDTDELVGKSTGSYFASDESPGPKRAVENLRESAWWSMHLAESMFWRTVTVIVGIVVGCVMLLNASVTNLAQPQPATTTIPSAAQQPIETKSGASSQTVKIVTSAILFIFSYGLLKFATGYYSFSTKSKQVKESAESLIKSGQIDEIQAIKLWQDYHLAREAAPIIPTWIWKHREKRLNALWNCYVKDQGKKQIS